MALSLAKIGDTGTGAHLVQMPYRELSLRDFEIDVLSIYPRRIDMQLAVGSVVRGEV